MNPFAKFNHFIAYFIPGVVLFITILLFLSSLIGINFIFSKGLFTNGIFVLLICGTVLGLFLDEIRHTFIEVSIENQLLKDLNYDPEKIEDFIAYIPRGLDIKIYELIRDEYFYFYEFDYNIGLVFLFLSIALPYYLFIFFNISSFCLLSILFLFLVVAILFLKLGRGAYKYFLVTFFETMENVEPGFKEKIK